jgi:hypothetical protein
MNHERLERNEKEAERDKVGLIPKVKNLPDDADWEKIESRLAWHATRNIPEPE